MQQPKQTELAEAEEMVEEDVREKDGMTNGKTLDSKDVLQDER